MQLRNRFIDLIKKVPFGVWLLALGLSVQFSPVITYKIKGGAVVCLIFLIGMLFCRSSFCKEGFFNAVSRAARDNAKVCILLAIFYIIAVAAWFYAPYNIVYEDVQHIWKKMLLNIFAIFIGLFLSRHSQFTKTLTLFCIPCALYQTVLMRNVFAAEGLEARYFLGEDAGGGFLGTYHQWEPIAMLSVMLIGLMMTIENKIAKIGLGVFAVFFGYMVLQAGYATPFALLLIGCGMMGVSYLRFGSSKRTNVAIKIGVFALFLLGAIFGFIYVAKSAETGDMVSESIAIRFYNFMLNPSGGGYDVENSRFKAMYIGLESFCDSPIFGRGGEYPSPRYDVSAGHYAMTDYLGHYGLVGGGSYIMFVLLSLSYLYSRYKHTRDWFDCAKLAVGMMFFVGGVVNPGWRDLPMSTFLIFCSPFKNNSESLAMRFRQIPYPPYGPPPMYGW